MGKKRLRGSRQNQQDTTVSTAASTVSTSARRARVRNRLLVSVTLCAVAVLAAGAPGVATASHDLTESQRLVDRADLGLRAISLSHALADERDAVVRRAAAAAGDGTGNGAGDPGAAGNEALPGDPGLPGSEGLPADQGTAGDQATPEGGKASEAGGPTGAERARVDSRIRELRADAPAGVRRLLEEFPAVRKRALAGRSDAGEAYDAYTRVIQSLGGITAATTRALPGRAENATADALPDLGRAAEQASAARGLLLAALAAGGAQPELTAAGQQAHLREQAALADFRQTARAADRDAYDRTVTGTDVTLAERYLARLTDQPRLDARDLQLNRARVGTALNARVDRMRSMESSLAVAEVERLRKLRDDDLTALELRIALLGICLLLTVGISVQTARSTTRPLAVLRLGTQRVADDPVGQEPVAYKGRNDEFADVVRAVNRLREAAVALHERAGEAEAQAVELAAERKRLQRELTAMGERLEGGSGVSHGTFVHLALRTLGLVERQLALLDGMEHQEKEPERLAALFKLDHLATRMRRHSENLLLLAGAEHATGQVEPVPLLDVLRAAISEVDRYERVELTGLPQHAQVSGPAAGDVSHLIAELVDNAMAFSPPESGVRLSGWKLESGEIVLSVQDEGIGVTSERLAELNAQLAGEHQGGPEDDSALGMGLYVVARLAARHRIKVELREQEQGGIAAVVVLPKALLPDRPMPGAAVKAAVGEVPVLPGTVAEANDNALPSRKSRAEKTEDAENAADAENTADAADEDAGASGPAEPAGSAGESGAPEESAPAEHGRTEDEAPVPGPLPEEESAPAGRTVTAKGLPKRTPRTVPTGASVPRPRAGGLKAEELRRRLGGFQQGAREGLREAEARIAAEESGRAKPTGTGGTVEEARK
ncbi:nitrate- and nitrite sensing domain-containing protein [Streptomyces glaucosporus]|uniref:histidine kinase n=1 Tax=Streptomyces glaucosporus TaxID=284044 RepID=A0ABN3IC13_9ACTN